MGNAAVIKKTSDSVSQETDETYETLSLSQQDATNQKEENLIKDPELENALVYIKANKEKVLIFESESISEKIAESAVIEYFEKIVQYHLYFKNAEYQRTIGDELTNLDISKLLVEYLNKITDNGQSFPLSGNESVFCEILMVICERYSDVSTELQRQLCETGLVSYLITLLKLFKNSYTQDKIIRNMVLVVSNILHNCTNFGENREFYQDTDVIDTIAWYAKNSSHNAHEKITTVTAMTLAYIVEEKDNDVIEAGDTIIKTIVILLGKALTSDDHCQYGFRASELTAGLCRLANNSSNSVNMVKHGILNHLKVMLESGDDVEKEKASKTIWTLSFVEENKKQILESTNIIELLSNLARNTKAINLKKSANGAMWMLQKKEDEIESKLSDPKTIKKKKVASKKLRKSDSRSGRDSGHIMMSYQWDHQNLMIKIKKELELHGYKVWMDLEQMGGSTLQKMAEAVENAAVVLISMSRKYKESINCRTEAEYAYKRKITVIPLQIEQGYDPDGWLGAIVGSKFYFDFTDISKFKKIFSLLLKELKETNEETTVYSMVNSYAPQTVHFQSKNDSSLKLIKSWKENEVKMWLEQNDINFIVVSSLDGEILSFLSKLKQEAPEFFYRFITEKFSLTDIHDLIKFSNAIDSLV